MSGNTTFFSTNGTAALKPDYGFDAVSSSSFVAFRGSARQDDRPRSVRSASKASASESISSTIRDVIERSEMACSLMTEDFKGVAYNTFTRASIASLSIGCTLVAIVSLAFGA